MSVTILSGGDPTLAKALGNMAQVPVDDPEADVGVCLSGLKTKLKLGRMVNSPESVSVVESKRDLLETLSRLPVPVLEWTSQRETALGWLAEGCRVFSVVGNQSPISESPAELPAETEVFTREKLKLNEVRVHCLMGTVFSQEKEPDPYVKQRSSALWSSAMEMRRRKLASRTQEVGQSLGLELFSVDWLYNRLEDEWYLRDVNVAPDRRDPGVAMLYAERIRDA